MPGYGNTSTRKKRADSGTEVSMPQAGIRSRITGPRAVVFVPVAFR